MPLAEDIVTTRYSIQAYDDGQITINERIYTGSLLLSPDELISPWPVTSVEQLAADHLEPILRLQPDVVLLGTGAQQVFPDLEIIGVFARQRLGLEVMNNGALCRTFNIIAAEGRQVVAAIIQKPAEADRASAQAGDHSA